jgi:hypothetical protein
MFIVILRDTKVGQILKYECARARARVCVCAHMNDSQ